MQMTKLEEELFDAVEVGDVAGVLRLFKSHPELDVDATDSLGRTPLNLATSNEHEEVKSLITDLLITVLCNIEKKLMYLKDLKIHVVGYQFQKLFSKSHHFRLVWYILSSDEIAFMFFST